MSLVVISKEKTRQSIIVLFVILVMLVHTSWIGRIVNELFLFFPLIGILFLLLIFEKRLQITSSKLILLFLSVLFAYWIFFQVMVLIPSGWYNVTSRVLGILVAVTGSAFFIKNRDVQLVLKTIMLVVVILSISQLITAVLYLVGLEDAIQIMIVDTVERFGERAVMIQPLIWYAPYTFTAHIAKINNQVFPRAIGMWREPGIYQMFVVLSYFSLDFVDVKHRTFLRIILILSLLTAFSTTGYGLFLVCLIYKNIFLRRRRYSKQLGTLMLAIVVLVMFNTTTASFGLKQKLGINQKRLQTPIESFELLMEKPLIGYSMASNLSTKILNIRGEENLGISFLSSVHKIGLVGFFLYFGIVFFSVKQFYDIHTLVLLLPVLGTLLIAQPIFTTGFVFLMLFLPCRYLTTSGKEIETPDNSRCTSR